jgi:sigma-B regulation protein RsbU (phosphoserine phosphatase)
LGIDPTCKYHSQQIALESGDVLYLYSDGVTEAENPEGEILGLRGLSDIINATNPAQAEKQIKVIVESLDVYRRDLPLRDDVTLLLVRALPEGGISREVIPFVIPAELAAVSQLVDLVRTLNQTLPISDAKHRRQIADDFALALSEVVANQVEHSFQGQKGQIYGRVIVDTDKLAADLYDNGVPFQPSKSPKIQFDPDDPPERGYGLRLIRGLLDLFECYRLEGELNHWHLVKMFSGVDKL